MLSDRTLATLSASAAAFAGATPFRHVVIDEFLRRDVADRLLAQFPGFDQRYAINEMGDVGGKAVRTRVRDLGEAYAALDDFLQTPAFLERVSHITGIPDLLYDPDYEGGGTHENRQGQSLDAHIDFNYHPRTGWHRRLNLIVYLNPEWEQEWGGTLQLHRDPWTLGGERVDVLPLFNRCVVFETNEVSWHGFEAISLPPSRDDLSRRSFAIYLYTRERPAEETAPPHATVYVPDGMPSTLVEGSVLDAERLLDLRARFARLRGQLRFLYQREMQFSAQIVALQRELAESLAAQHVDVFGWARLSDVNGRWPDGWCGRRLVFALTAERPLREVAITLWVPPALGPSLELRWRCGELAGQSVARADGITTLRLPLRLARGAKATLVVDADNSWVPGAADPGGDQRALAFRVLQVEVDHS